MQINVDLNCPPERCEEALTAFVKLAAQFGDADISSHSPDLERSAGGDQPARET